MLWAISSILCIIPSLTIIYYALQLPKSVLYLYHPLLMSIAYILIFTTLAHQLRKQVTAKWSILKDKRKVHSYGMIAAAVMAIAGFFVIYINKELKPDSSDKSFSELHFTSWHGKFGLLTTISLFIQVLLGLSTFFKQARILPENVGVSDYRRYHAFFGIVFSISSCLVLVTAFQTGWFEKQFEAGWKLYAVQYSFSAIIVFAYGLIVLQVYHRYRNTSI